MLIVGSSIVMNHRWLELGDLNAADQAPNSSAPNSNFSRLSLVAYLRRASAESSAGHLLLWYLSALHR